MKTLEEILLSYPISRKSLTDYLHTFHDRRYKALYVYFKGTTGYLSEGFVRSKLHLFLNSDCPEGYLDLNNRKVFDELMK